MSDISKIKKDIELNEDIDESIKESIKETFGSMLELLGKKDFLRWVRKQEISKVARQTIYKICTEEEDSYLKEYKEISGYHTSPENSIDGKRKIVLRRDAPEGREVRSHETWHAFANGFGGFSKFFGEGITELLNQYLYKRGSSAYYKNVKIVDLINLMYGTGIIREYLMQKGETFLKKLAYQIDGTNKLSEANLIPSTTFIDLKSMEAFFEGYHNALYTDSAVLSENDGERFFDKGLSILMDTYFEYEKTQIDSMSYYRNGKIDFEGFNKKLSKVMKKSFFMGYDEDLFYERYDELIDNLIENSHLLYGITDREKSDRKEHIAILVKKQFDKYSVEGVLEEIDQENDSVFQEANEYTEFKLMKQKLKTENLVEDANTKNEIFNYIKYFDFLSIIKEKTGISEEYLEVMISQISMDMSENPEKFAEITKNVLGKYAEVLELDRDLKRKNSAIESTKPLYQVGSKVVHAIKRDNEYQILIFDRETGKIETLPLDDEIGTKSGNMQAHRIMDFEGWNQNLPNAVNIELMYNEFVYEIEGIGGRGEKTYISIDRGMNEVSFMTDKSKKEETLENGFDEVKDSAISQLVFAKILDDVEQGKYSSSEKGKVLYEKIISEYFDIADVMPADIDYEVFEKVVEIAIEKSFPKEKILPDIIEKPEENYDYLKDSLIKSIKRIGRIAGGELSDKTIKIYQSRKEKIDNLEKELRNLLGIEEKSETISKEDSLVMINDIINHSKEKTGVSAFKEVITEMEKEEKKEEIQK